MKKILTIISTIILLFSQVNLSNENIKTDSYIKVIENDTYFYSSQTLSKESELFCLPKGYFLKVVAESESTIECEYASTTGYYSKIIGYVKTKKVKNCSAISPIYPNVTSSTISTASMYSQPNSNCELVLTLFPSQTVAVYGYARNQNFVFCYFGNDFGYINIKDLDEINIPKHPLDLSTPKPSIKPTFTPTVTPTDEVTPTVSSPTTLSKPIQIILAVFIGIPLIIAIIFLFSFQKD